jgi:N-acylneuraminate cytidylyltransferase
LRVLIIPARGGSKGIDKKNLQTVNGISLVERTIKSALQAKVDKIIVSTDDSEIKGIASKYAVEIHDRSKETSSDTSSTESVILEVISNFEKKWKTDASIGFCQVTSPFIESQTISECFSLADKGFSAFSAVEFHGFTWSKDDTWKPVDHPIDHRPRRQDLYPKVKETGAIYCFPLQSFKQKKYRICSEPYPVLVNPVHGIEIDDLVELQLANLIATQYEVNNLDQLSNFQKPKIIFTDFDGCLTDDKVKVNIFGKESVKANRKDGLAVKRLKKLGIEVVITTMETNEVVVTRAKKMKVEALRGLEDKVQAISDYLNKQSLSWADVWYVGNDVNDLGAISNAALSFCPIDASPEVIATAQIVLSRRGGEGLLAEIASRLERDSK